MSQSKSFKSGHPKITTKPTVLGWVQTKFRSKERKQSNVPCSALEKKTKTDKARGRAQHIGSSGHLGSSSGRMSEVKNLPNTSKISYISNASEKTPKIQVNKCTNSKRPKKKKETETNVKQKSAAPPNNLPKTGASRLSQNAKDRSDASMLRFSSTVAARNEEGGVNLNQNRVLSTGFSPEYLDIWTGEGVLDDHSSLSSDEDEDEKSFALPLSKHL